MVEPRQRPSVARRFDHRRGVAEPPARDPARVFLRRSLGQRVPLGVLAVEAQLIGELAIQPVAAKPVDEATQQLSHGLVWSAIVVVR
jgi:hypothetical protein